MAARCGVNLPALPPLLQPGPDIYKGLLEPGRGSGTPGSSARDRKLPSRGQASEDLAKEPSKFLVAPRGRHHLEKCLQDASEKTDIFPRMALLFLGACGH